MAGPISTSLSGKRGVSSVKVFVAEHSREAVTTFDCAEDLRVEVVVDPVKESEISRSDGGWGSGQGAGKRERCQVRQTH